MPALWEDRRAGGVKGSASPSVRPPEAPLDEKELIERARAGDADAFAGIVARYRDRVYRLACGLVGNAEDADDVAQEVFVKAYYRLETFTGASAFYTWLYRVAVNAAADWRKRWRRRRLLSIEDGPFGAEGVVDETPRPERLAYGRELMDRVRAALTKMPGKFSSIIVLRDLEGLTYEEIAEVLKVPKGTVESRLYRARERLRELIEQYL